MPKKEDSDVELAKNIAEVGKIRRKAKLDSFKDHADIFVRYLFGLISLIGGVIGEVAPNMIPLTTGKPRMYMAIGLSLLVGNKVVTVIAKVTNALKS